MRVSPVAVLSGLTALALAEAVPAPSKGKPRYYFPREIKRQVGGQNSTSDSTTASSSDGLLNGLSSVLSLDPSTTATTTDTQNSVVVPLTNTLNSVVTSLVSSPASSPSDSSGTASNTGGIVISSPTTDSQQPTGSQVQTSQQTLSATTATAASDTGGILSSLVGTLLPTTSSSGIVITPPAQITQPSSTNGITGPGTGSTTEPDASTSQNPVDSLTSGLLNPDTSQTIITPPAATTSTDSGILPTSLPTTASGIITPPSDTTTTSPVGTGPTTTPPGATDTTLPIAPPTNLNSTTPWSSSSGDTTSAISTEATPNVVPTATSPISTSTPSKSDEDSSAPQTIKPTATNSLTSLTQESSIVSASSSTPTGGTPSSIASTIPSSLPRIIQPNGGVPTAPNNSTLIQLGFTYGLNYPFVVSNNWAVQQIFDYLPPGVAHGVDIDVKDVVMQYLQPYNTLSRNGYITTLAMAYIPSAQVNPLSLALLNPKSQLYNNDNPTVKTLVNMLDPSIPLLAGQTIGNGNPINSANSATTTNPGNGGGVAGGYNNGGDSSVKPSSIGIGLGVVGGAAVYGVAMFMVAKRYKKRKNAHRRASSVQSGGSGPRETNTLMTGARHSYGSRQPGYNTAGRDSRNSDRSHQSGRTYISPPVMAENSLGWN